MKSGADGLGGLVSCPDAALHLTRLAFAVVGIRRDSSMLSTEGRSTRLAPCHRRSRVAALLAYWRGVLFSGPPKGVRALSEVQCGP